jgi:hypothetical protein
MSHIAKNSGNGSDGALISGRGLAHRKLTVNEQIKLAADLATGERQLELSRTQAAKLVGVSTTQLRTELKARAEAREAAQRRAMQACEGSWALVSSWDSASEYERAEAIRIIGVANVWDTLVRVID